MYSKESWCIKKRLRRFKNNMKKVNLDDGKGLGVKGRLTDVEIDKLQAYYGQAIRKKCY